MAGLKNGVQKLLRDKNGIAVQDEWLDACVQWIVEEEGSTLSVQKAYELVYEQWLHADIRDVTLTPSLPPLNSDKGVLTANFTVQVTSVVDVGCAAYGQLQKLKGRSIDSAETPDKKSFEPKPTRLLLLTLTDSASKVQAMEYAPIKQLTGDMSPGTKLLLKGDIPYRLGMLLLSADNVVVLGGGVEQLATEHSAVRVLSRILNLEESTTDDPAQLPTSTSHQNQSSTSQQPQQAVTVSSRSEHSITQQQSSSGTQYHTSHQASLQQSQSTQGVSTSTGIAHQPSTTRQQYLSHQVTIQTHHSTTVQQSTRQNHPSLSTQHQVHLSSERATDNFEIGLDDFGMDEDELMQVESMIDSFGDQPEENEGQPGSGQSEGILTGGGHPESDQEHRLFDMPGHDEWPEEAEDDLLNTNFGDYCMETTTNTDSKPPMHNQNSFQIASNTSTVDDRSSTSTSTSRHIKKDLEQLVIAPECLSGIQGPMCTAEYNVSQSNQSFKSRLSLKQQSSRTRMVEVSPLKRAPPVASVRPVQRTEDVVGESQDDNEPVLIESLSQMSKSVWLSHPRVKVYAWFTSACKNMSHNSGGWVAYVNIADKSGTKKSVRLSNTLLENMIGFTAVEFRNHINPNRTDPIVKKKASKGFALLWCLLAQLKGYMIIERPVSTEPPCVLKVLDS